MYVKQVADVSNDVSKADVSDARQCQSNLIVMTERSSLSLHLSPLVMAFFNTACAIKAFVKALPRLYYVPIKPLLSLQ